MLTYKLKKINVIIIIDMMIIITVIQFPNRNTNVYKDSMN
jgi:hypothetical protein